MENSEMKDRIAHIIRAKNLTAAEFALRLGIQQSNISHLLSGRNNPSLDFVKKLKETFPEYNLDWIVFGKGPMTVSEPFDTTPPEKPDPVHEQALYEPVYMVQAPEEPPVQPSSAPSLKQIILVYSDNTFEQISPR
jgi:transcriptional regulator with XRE-family HTH domain